jgi:AraC-like DNA-binding protein
MMFFQIENGSHFFQNQSVVVPESHHSLNYLPYFQTGYHAAKNSLFHSVCVKLEPSLVLNEWLDPYIDEEWYRLLQNYEPFVTFHRSKPMNRFISESVHQLVNCPYKGRLAVDFKEALIKLLFLSQRADFRDGTERVACINDKKLSRRDIEALHEVRSYLEAHFLDDLSLGCIVRKFGLNMFKLKYGFKMLYNTPVMRFIDQKKMNYAKQLLLDQSEIDRFDIADRLGYNHYSNFSNAFKKHFGYSPTTFKCHDQHHAGSN